MNYFFLRFFNKVANTIDNRQLRRFEARRMEKLLRERKNSPLNILYLCTGNICRSAFADVLTRDLLHLKYPNLDINIFSAGTNTGNGLPANSDAIRIAKNFDLDLTNHKTQRLTRELADKSTIIFAMEPVHVLKLASICKKSLNKTFLLSALDELEGISVIDPYAKSDQVFIETFSRIKSAVEKLLGIENKYAQ